MDNFSLRNCNCPAVTPAGPTVATTCGFNASVIFMATLELSIRSSCFLNDPCNRPSSRFRKQPDDEYDFIVIGGGSAGAVVASRLSEESQWKVLLIEAGDDEPVGTQIPSMFLSYLNTDIDWKYTTEPEKNACLSNNGQRCNWPRGKVLGGTSVINGMMYMRGNREDYNNWNALGNPGWSYRHVIPYFKKSEDNLQLGQFDSKFHGSGGPMPVTQFPYHPLFSYKILEAGKELGFATQDLNGNNATGFMIAQTTSKNGIRYSSARSFLRRARHRNNLHILLNTTASKVLINPESKNVAGVEIIDKDGKKRSISVRKEVVVSAGAVSSPQILLLSGVGPKDDLKKVNVPVVHDLPGVGKNLHNHVTYYTNFFVNENDTALLNEKNLKEYLKSNNGPMSGTGISAVTAKIVSKYADNHCAPDIQFYFGGYLASCSKTGAVDEFLSNNPRSIQILPAVLSPKSRGYITLASNNPLDKPRIFANYLTDDRDIKVLIEGIKFAIKLSKTKALQQFGMRLDTRVVKGCEKFEFGSDDYWRCAVSYETAPENHQAGSCKMGPDSDPMAVVDHELRVKGINGLRVMDTSIMPSVTSGNTHAPAVMIAEKGVAMMKHAWAPWT